MADVNRSRRGKTPRPLLDRLMSSVTMIPESGCWIWTGAVCRAGYGKMGRGFRSGKTVKTHRVSWELFRGPIPDGMNVLHKCDVPSCINPNHLWIGTQDDNMRDMLAKGRGRAGPHFGEKNHNSKLTRADAEAIRTDPRRQIDIAAEYEISRSNVSSIKRGVTWG